MANTLYDENYGGKFDLPKTLLMTRSFVQNKAVIVIVSDFLGMQKGWARYVQLMADDYEVTEQYEYMRRKLVG